jgi:hypothetical protein
MSTIKTLVLIGLCLLLAGCAPAIGLKGVAVFLVAIGAAIGAGWCMMHDRDEIRVCEKARVLDEVVTVHVEKYHRASPSNNIVDLAPSHRGNGAAAPDAKIQLNQRG